MMHDYNSFQLVKFIYGEASLTDTFEVEYALQTDSAIKAEYDELIGAKNMLPKVTFSPDTSAIQNILNYSLLNLQMS
jgi:hypothetical protein